jgi:hypothetical protein
MKLEVSGTFYVGWRQFGTDRLNVGLDMNIINNDKVFYSIDGEVSWIQSQIPGTVMMRPLFSTGMDVSLGIEDNVASVKPAIVVYPNPTNGIVTIDVDDATYEGVEVFDLQGRLIVDTDLDQVDLSQNPNGIYILKLKGIGEIIKVIKH